MWQSIFLLALASLTSGIALRVIEPMLPRLASDFGTSVSAASSVITAYAIAYSVGQLIYGPLGDRYGKLRVVTLSMFGAALACAACAFSPNLASLTAMRFITALFSSAPVTLGIAYIGDQVAAAKRQAVIARFVVGTIIGQALGSLVGGVVTDLFGWRATFLSLALLFALVPILLLTRTRTQWQDGGRPSARGNPFTVHIRVLALARARYVVCAGFINTFFFFGAYSFIGAYLKYKFHLSLALIGAILTCVGIGSVLYTLLVNPLLRRLGQRGLVTWGGAICCGCYALTALTPYWALTLPLAIGLGFSFYMLQNTLQVKAAEMAPQARATGVSLYTWGWSLGQAAGVASGALVIAAVGYVPVLIAFGCGFFALGLWLRNHLGRLS